MWKRRDRGDGFAQAVKVAVDAAVSDATTATILAAHIKQCELDKADIKSALATQDAERQRMHAANEAAFARINRVIWIANGIGIAIMFFSSGPGQMVLAKFAGH